MGKPLATYEEKELYLLNVIPSRDLDPYHATWDYGLEVSPGAHLAKDEINNRSDILPGYSLKVIDVGSEACGHSVIVDGLVNLYSHLVNRGSFIVGVTGMLCSSVTNVLVPVLSHPKINYLTIAASTSPEHRNLKQYPLLFHILSSSQIYNEALLKLMKEFKWSEITLVYDSSRFYFLSTGLDFIQKIQSHNKTKLTTTVAVNSEIPEHEILSILQQARAKIIFASVTDLMAARLICGAYKQGLSYPAYVLIFHDHTFEGIIDYASYNYTTTCTEEEIRKGMEGVLILRYRLTHFYPEKVLISGTTYDDFYQEYRHRVFSLGLEENSYAAVQYDQVWAFALALNLSLGALETSGTVRNQHITETILNNLVNVSFEGATGTIQFGESRETKNAVDIFQAMNGSNVSIGTYLPYKEVVNYTEEGESLLQNVPCDHFLSVYSNKIPLWLGVSILTLCGLTIILITINLILFLYWRRQPAIKASSPWLSMCVFVGCYLLSSSVAAQTIQLSFFHGSVKRLFIAVCYTDIWFGSIGFLLIFGTLLVRLLRIFWIFSRLGRMSRFWQNRYLFLGVMTICLLNAIVLLLWALVDPVQRKVSIHYVLAKPLSYYEVFATCSSQSISVWHAVSFIYCGITMLFVLFLAFQSRHIRYQNFKDTKKLIAFVFSVVLIFSVCLTLWNMFGVTRIPVASHVAFCAAYLSVAILCQILIFAPKITPLVKMTIPRSLYNIIYCN